MRTWLIFIQLSIVVTIPAFGIEDTESRIKKGEAVMFPPGTSAEERTVRAEWIQAAVTNGTRIALTRAIIKGDLNLHSTVFAADFFLVACSIEDEANFSKATFAKDVACIDTHWAKPINFQSAVFNQDVLFQRTVFVQNVHFENTTTRGTMAFREVTFGRDSGFDFSHWSKSDFSSSTFQAEAGFREVDFGTVVHFEGAEFSLVHFDGAKAGSAFFGRNSANTNQPATFHGKAFFNDAQFRYANFIGVVFRDEFTLRGSDMLGTATFALARFETNADFSGVVFSKPTNFRSTYFGKAAIFDGSRSSAIVNFDGAVFNGPASFRFASFRGLEFSPTGLVGTSGDKQFRSSMNLSGCSYEEITANRDALLDAMRKAKPYDRMPFRYLELYYKKLGDNENADCVYLTGMDLQNVEQPSLRGFLYKWMLNYGVRPWGLLVLAMASMATGTFFLARLGNVKIRDATTQKSETQLSVVGAFLLSFRYFFIIELPILSEFEVVTQVAERKHRRVTTVSIVASVLKIIGWIVIPLFTLWLAGLMRT